MKIVLKSAGGSLGIRLVDLCDIGPSHQHQILKVEYCGVQHLENCQVEPCFAKDLRGTVRASLDVASIYSLARFIQTPQIQVWIPCRRYGQIPHNMTEYRDTKRTANHRRNPRLVDAICNCVYAAGLARFNSPVVYSY